MKIKNCNQGWKLFLSLSLFSFTERTDLEGSPAMSKILWLRNDDKFLSHLPKFNLTSLQKLTERLCPLFQKMQNKNKTCARFKI